MKLDEIERNEGYFEEYHPGYRAEFDPRNYTLHKKIKEKYNYTCQKCGVDRDFIPSIPIDIHHIDGMPWNNNERNLIVLCRKCHNELENKTNYKYGGYFFYFENYIGIDFYKLPMFYDFWKIIFYEDSLTDWPFRRGIEIEYPNRSEHYFYLGE